MTATLNHREVQGHHQAFGGRDGRRDAADRANQPNRGYGLPDADPRDHRGSGPESIPLAYGRRQPAPTRRSERRPQGPDHLGVYVPPGWPESVRPPGAPDWEATAAAFLLDCCPPDFRAYPVLRRHPVVLARFAAEFVESQYRAAKEGLAEVRVNLAEHVSPQVVEEAADAWSEQAAQLVRVRRAVALVEEALRGKVFIRRL